MKNISICPYCGHEMNLGFIHGDRYPLKWIPEEKDKGVLLQWFSKGIKLTDALTSSIKSFYCEDCKKLIIDIVNDNN